MTKYIKYGIIAVVSIIVIVLLASTMTVRKIEGNEAIVAQHWKRGVLENVYLAGTHFFIPGFFYETYMYDIGTQKITFDSSEDNLDAEYDSIKVNLGENGGQSAWIPISVNYRIGHELTEAGPKFSADKLIALHNDGLRDNYESVILKRTVVEVVNRIARPKEALEIYSGAGFNTFSKQVEKALITHEVFTNRGILIENVIVYNVNLNPNYEAEIEAKQLAIQKALREKEERKAADEKALRAKSEAQAEVETRTQKAEAAKQERIKAAEASAQEQVLAAEAEKQKRVLEAEGERDANLAKASGILEVGKAEAEVQELKREALYAGESGAWRAQVEIATAQAEKLKGMFENVSIVPEKTILNLGQNATGLKMTIPAE